MSTKSLKVAMVTKINDELSVGVCKTLCPQHLLVPKYGQICSVIIPQKNLDFAQTSSPIFKGP